MWKNTSNKVFSAVSPEATKKIWSKYDNADKNEELVLDTKEIGKIIRESLRNKLCVITQRYSGSTKENSEAYASDILKHLRDDGMITRGYSYGTDVMGENYLACVRAIMYYFILPNVCTKFDFTKPMLSEDMSGSRLMDEFFEGRLKCHDILIDLYPLLYEYKWNRNVTLKGNFYLSYPVDSTVRSNMGKLTIEGNLYLLPPGKQSYIEKEIELPQKFTIDGSIINNRANDNYKKYNSLEEYNNRPTRLARLSARKDKKDKLKQINDSGLLTFKDANGMPLEVGCNVAFYNGYKMKTGVVLSQTENYVKVQGDRENYSENVYPERILRMS